MNAYFIATGNYRPDLSLLAPLEAEEIPAEEVELSQDAESAIALFKNRDPGIIFIPPVWDDLFCVKVIDNIETLRTPFETVIADRQPLVPNLVAAYNAGLSAFVELPLKPALFKQAMIRCRARLEKKIALVVAGNRLRAYERDAVPNVFSPQIMERDQLLSQAFMDLIQRKGPLLGNDVRLLLALSSEAQQQRFGTFLRSIGLQIATANNMGEALRAVEHDGPFAIVISDYILPDGDAAGLVNAMRKTMKDKMPRFIVMTGSPDKASDLLRPESHIDDVIIKPGPGHGIELILPAVISGIYQVRG